MFSTSDTYMAVAAGFTNTPRAYVQYPNSGFAGLPRHDDRSLKVMFNGVPPMIPRYVRFPGYRAFE